MKRNRRPPSLTNRATQTARIGQEWIDISVPIRTGMVHYPGTPKVTIRRVQAIRVGDHANESRISMGVHSGTHIDAPIHFLPDGEGIDLMPWAAGIGRATVIRIDDRRRINKRELMRHPIATGDRILFKTENSSRGWETTRFLQNFVYLATDAARWLVNRGVQTVGIDYLSIGGYKRNGPEVHRLLLRHGIWIIEGLNLTAVEPGSYDLICLPLRIVGADGAPARAILRSSTHPAQ
jgi:arylformamidase